MFEIRIGRNEKSLELEGSRLFLYDIKNIIHINAQNHVAYKGQEV